MKKWRTGIVPLSKMNPAPYNPRIKLLPGDPEYDSLEKSMNELGYLDLITWNEATGNIIGGHRRYDIFAANGEKEVDAVIVYEPDLTREKLMNLALNKITGRWDNDVLRNNIQEIQEQVDLAIAGFNQEEIDELFRAAEKQDFISDLLCEDFISPATNPRYFQITFAFEVSYKDMVNEYLKEHGKDELAKYILDYIKGAK